MTDVLALSGRLALAIPTYNRAEILKENLERMLPELRRFAVPIYVSDDSSNDETENVCDQLRALYPQVHYRRNRPALGHDQNGLATIAWPQEPYVWFLGDSMFIEEGGVADIMHAIATNPDFIFLASRPGLELAASMRSAIPPEAFFRQFTWHLTQSGVTVYGPSPLEHIRRTGAQRAYPNFMQLGLILQCAQHDQPRISWVQRLLFRNSRSRTSYWSRDAVKVFAGDWCALIDASRALWGAHETEVAKSHARNTGILGLKNLVALRAGDALTAGLVSRYEPQLARASTVPLPVIRLISRLPVAILSGPLAAWKRLKNLLSA